jgi:hypothetical protein
VVLMLSADIRTHFTNTVYFQIENEMRDFI